VSIIYKKTYIYVKFLCCVEEYDENALLIITVSFEYIVFCSVKHAL